MARSVPGCSYARRVAGEETLHVHRGLDLPLLGDLLARHHVGRARGAARQPHAQPGRGAVRRRRIARRSARASGRGCCERLGPVVRASASESRSQARNRELALAASGDQARRGPAGPAGPDAHPADQELPGAAGGGQAAARPDEAAAAAAPATTTEAGPPRRSAPEAEAREGGRPARVELGQQLGVLLGPRVPAAR